MAKTMGRSLLTLVGFAAVATCLILAQEAPKGTESRAWQIFLQINQERKDAHLKPLRWNAQLAAAARPHCERMSLEGSLARRFPGEGDVAERVAEAGFQFSDVEEDLGLGSGLTQIPKEWFDSSAPDMTFLNPNMDSVGVAVSESHGMLYVVADYAQSAPPFKQDEMEKIVEKQLYQGGLAIVADKSDARILCAGGNILKAKPSYVVTWENQDLTQLPDNVKSALTQGHFRKVAVGVCRARDLAWQPNTYRVAMLLYSDGEAIGVY